MLLFLLYFGSHKCRLGEQKRLTYITVKKLQIYIYVYNDDVHGSIIVIVNFYLITYSWEFNMSYNVASDLKRILIIILELLWMQLL